MNPFHFLVRLCAGLGSRARNLWFRALGVRMGGYVWMRKISIPRQWSDVTLEQGVMLDDGVVLLCSSAPKRDKLIIRYGTYVNRHTIFTAHERIEVGRNCMIGPQCYLTDGNHGSAAGVPVKDQPMQTKPVILEDEVWLGAGVTVLPGVRLGRGCIIGAGAVVTGDIPANAIAVGVPAKVIKQRG